MSGDRELCLDTGMDDYLPKPLRLDEIKQALKKWLKNLDTPTIPDTVGALREPGNGGPVKTSEDR
jgi:DNA-binding response OmpR family regulator